MPSRANRSLLFVPAIKESWIHKVADTGTDACVLDLEDSVPPAERPAAREVLRSAIPSLSHTDLDVFVRVNDLHTDDWLDDLDATAVAGVTGIALPKVESAEEIAVVDTVLNLLERKRGLEPGSIEIQPLFETARGIHDACSILRSSPRIRSYWGGSARGGDANREIGFRWSPEGKETLFIRSKLVLDGRAAGIANPIGGTWTDIDDVEGFTNYARENRDLGYAGMYLIHPSQVPVANDLFTPTAEEVAEAREIIELMHAGHERGLGAVKSDGKMLDAAMVAHAEALLAKASLYSTE